MYERFDELRKLFGVTVAKICAETGINKSTMSEWKNGKFRLKDDKRKALANYFGVSLAVLDGEEPIPDYLMNRYSAEYHETVDAKPIYDLAAGQGRVNGDFAEEYKTADTDSEEYTWCRIYGDSMYPELHDGDMVKVHLQTETTPQDLTVVKINGDEATVKYVEITDKGVWLRAINKDVFQDRFFSVSEVMTLPVSIIGKVTMFQRSYL